MSYSMQGWNRMLRSLYRRIALDSVEQTEAKKEANKRDEEITDAIADENTNIQTNSIPKTEL